MFLMEDRGRADDKILGVPVSDPRWTGATDLDDLSPHLLRELEHFFSVYKDLEDAKTATHRWRDASEAVRVTEASGLAAS